MADTDIARVDYGSKFMTAEQIAHEYALKAEARRKAVAVIAWFGEKYNLDPEELSEIRGALGLAQQDDAG